ncbi:hypothetical protein Acy02nite_47370 [Actinoplanes cyaneus]|uniref:Uncharacterized protein n=1 Tax=Actinoplanes cyaneus TaxID=52696 RepID=A0A919IKP6_9ACTN|nr:hypothetical protein Acy02nite_47370 [Actinoplanes cyaneus]
MTKAPEGTVVLAVDPDATVADVLPPIFAPPAAYHSKTPATGLPSGSVSTVFNVGVSELT